MSQDIIAIDGPGGSGKSTVARSLAARLGWAYLDTGAMYRAVTAEVLAESVSLRDEEAVIALAAAAVIATTPRVSINGRDVEDEIRSDAVNDHVSAVAAIPRVRVAMVERQRAWAAAQERGAVVEGRDITTVVFPHATLKVYLTASFAERARRREDESAQALGRRDTADHARIVSPLVQAADAVVIDTTNLSVETVVEEIVSCLRTLS
ncbi:MAG: (d)CMP kinase [Acidimicrobiales bacterium]